MSTKLWDFFDGEPFMENPPLAIIGNPHLLRSENMSNRNPLRYKRRISRSRYEYDYVKKSKSTSKRKKGVKMAAKKHRKASSKRRGRKGRKNSFPMAGVVANPRVYYMRRKKHSRRRGRKNPAILGVQLPPLSQILYAGAGFIATPMVEGYANKFLPVSVTSSVIGRYATKVASVIGLAWLTKQVIGVSESRMVAVGGASYVLTSAVNEFMPSLTMSSYHSGTIDKYRGMQAYRQGQINGYAMPQLARNLPSLAAPIWGARNAAAMDATGGVSVISQRLRRFQ